MLLQLIQGGPASFCLDMFHHKGFVRLVRWHIIWCHVGVARILFGVLTSALETSSRRTLLFWEWVSSLQLSLGVEFFIKREEKRSLRYSFGTVLNCPCRGEALLDFSQQETRSFWWLHFVPIVACSPPVLQVWSVHERIKGIASPGVYHLLTRSTQRWNRLSFPI